MKIVIASAFLLAASNALAQAPTPHSALADRPPEFSCSGQPLDFTRDDLEKKAFEEQERRHGQMPERYVTALKRWGCDWWVFVIPQPEKPGTDFGVLVDGITGDVKQYVKR